MRKVLFIKLGAIGDVVMAMTAVRRMVQLEPDLRLVWIASSQVQGLISKFIPEAKIHTVNETRLLRQGPLQSAVEVMLTRLGLGASRAALRAVGYRDRRYGLLAIGTARQTAWFEAAKGTYHADAYFSLLGGVPSVLRASPLHPKDLLPAIDIQAGAGVILAPGGAKNLLRDDALRRYPIEHYVSLARMALERGKAVTIMGAQSDEWVRPYFKELPVRFEIGTQSIEEIPLWLRQFERLITHDSGPMHLGFMSGIPVTALFGPTRADEKVPRNYALNGSIVIQGGQGLSCAPCYDGKNYAECAHQSCLKDVVPSVSFLG